MHEMTRLDEVQAIEDIMKQLPQVEIDVRNYFAGGIYEREIFVRAGTLITGKIHLTEHLAKLTSGRMRLYSEGVEGVFEGPMTIVSKPGIKRMGFAETDCYFSTFHVVGDETDVEKIENTLVVSSMQEYLEQTGENKKLEDMT